MGRETTSARDYFRPTSILVIFSLRAGPRGTFTATVSLRLRPISARPTGDSLESLCSCGFASAEPTIVYFTDLPVLTSLTCTTDPTWTTSVESSSAWITLARRSFSCRVAMRLSSIACSFLASSYSEFSVMSPNSRASLMRSATSRRLSVERTPSSSLSFCRPSGVRMTSFGMCASSGLVIGPTTQNPALERGDRGQALQRAQQYSELPTALSGVSDGRRERVARARRAQRVEQPPRLADALRSLPRRLQLACGGRR